MTTPISYPTVNGFRHEWASVELKLDGQIYYATAVNYSRKRTRTKVKVNHPDPIDKTRGENDYDADVEMLLAEYNAFQAALAAKATALGLNGGYGDVKFTTVVSYNEAGFDVVTDTITGCTMDSTEAGGKQGPDALTRKFDMSPLKILFNGLDDLAVPLQAPPT